MIQGVDGRDPHCWIVDEGLLQQIESDRVELFDLILQVVVVPAGECWFVVG